MDDEKICLISIGLVIVMFIGLAGMTYVDEEGWPWEKEEEIKEILLIQEGDEVSVDYVGQFIGVGGEAGLVFDTSIPEIAHNDSIPKSRTFRENPTYDDLSFTVGSGQMIQGFEESVLGKKEGQTYTIAIPPEKGYGVTNPDLVITVNTTQTIPLKETLDLETFNKLFFMIDIESTTSFPHPFWHWDVTIMSKDSYEVTILHQPVYNEEYKAFPWNTTVVDISTERNLITLHHDITEISDDVMVPYMMMTAYDPVMANEIDRTTETPPQEGIVTSKGGQIIIDFNTEVTGKTLIFQITINSIKRV